MFQALARSLRPRRAPPSLAITHHAQHHRSSKPAPAAAMNRPRNASGRPVPTTQDVAPGARVLVVLKADQPTGRQTPGVVQDVLTRGNHPRGIKVRLRDGQVGRVQRLQDTDASTTTDADGVRRYTHVQDARQDGYMYDDTGPPARRLADYVVGSPARGADALVCPLCGAFEGDEAAVTHHIDREHPE